MVTALERIAARFGPSAGFTLKPSLVMLGYVGSHSHGTYTPPTEPDAVDDVDFMGVVCPPPALVLGLSPFTHWAEQWEELDVVVYGLTRLVELLCKGNPNVLGLLWLRDEDIVYRTRVYDTLRDHRALFCTTRVFESFAGYAQSQLQRMTAYTPELEAEIQALTQTLVDAGWKVQDIMDGRGLPMPKGLTPDEANTKAQRLRTLRARYHQAYMGEKRRRLVVKYGYDTKNAAHLIRLLRMAEEYGQTGELQVYRTHDADELRAIKQGAWTLERVRDEAAAISARVQQLKAQSTRPTSVDRWNLNSLLAELHFEHWRAR